MPSMPIHIYVPDKQIAKYIEHKKEINQEVRDLVSKKLKELEQDE